MSGRPNDLTEQQIWIQTHGFYGFYWNFAPYNTPEYQKRFKQCMKNYRATFGTV